MPREVELVLGQLPSVREAHVVGIPDPRMGEVGCACIIPEDGESIDPDTLIAYCKERLARFKVPKHVIIVEPSDLPTTATGRVQKFRLAALAVDRVGTAEPQTATT